MTLNQLEVIFQWLRVVKVLLVEEIKLVRSLKNITKTYFPTNEKSHVAKKP